MLGGVKKQQLPAAHEALPGRAEKMPVPEKHFVNGHALAPPYPDGLELALFGLGCFWGAEKCFWQLPVYVTAVGYAGGYTPNPTYDEVCSGLTGHSEVVLVVYNPQETSFEQLLKVFWEAHDPTQGMRQGGDIGTGRLSMSTSTPFPRTSRRRGQSGRLSRRRSHPRPLTGGGRSGRSGW